MMVYIQLLRFNEKQAEGKCIHTNIHAVAQSVARLTQEPEVPALIPGPATHFRFSSADPRRAVVSYWRKYVHEVLVNRLGGLSLPRKSVVRLTDRPDMTTAVYRERRTTTHTDIHTYNHKLVKAPPSNLKLKPPPPPSKFIAGRPKADLLFWFFGDLDVADVKC